MAINHKLLKLNGNNITKICDYEVQYNKLWKDADRNMEGEVRATLIGVFPKLKIRTRTQEREKIALLGNILNLPSFDVEFYDPLDNTVKSAKYYSSDYSVKLYSKERELFHEMEFNLVPLKRRA